MPVNFPDLPIFAASQEIAREAQEKMMELQELDILQLQEILGYIVLCKVADIAEDLAETQSNTEVEFDIKDKFSENFSFVGSKKFTNKLVEDFIDWAQEEGPIDYSWGILKIKDRKITVFVKPIEPSPIFEELPPFEDIYFWGKSE